MKISKVDHIGIAVKDLEEALKLYRDILQLEVTGVEEVPDQKVKVAFIPVGESKVELLEPTTDDSPVAKFIAKRGEGIHHITFRVDNLEKALEEAKAAGIRLIDETPRLGAGGAKIAFLHPKSTGGVLLELCQRDD
ncbi:MAG: methylmalonyl-CoA epimerase [bacterium]|jgi:methylmalonyl-CoA/ethylmalonyl-CoA epimerase|nr:methylmalonyl-CoA epimerase [Bacillota bacterium]HHW55341.1 methylmalonyl-CoA epimerase [Bacillota bacterium]